MNQEQDRKGGEVSEVSEAHALEIQLYLMTRRALKAETELNEVKLRDSTLAFNAIYKVEKGDSVDLEQRKITRAPKEDTPSPILTDESKQDSESKPNGVVQHQTTEV